MGALKGGGKAIKGDEEASHDNGKALNGDARKPLKDDGDAKKGDVKRRRGSVKGQLRCVKRRRKALMVDGEG